MATSGCKINLMNVMTVLTSVHVDLAHSLSAGVKRRLGPRQGYREATASALTWKKATGLSNFSSASMGLRSLYTFSAAGHGPSSPSRYLLRGHVRARQLLRCMTRLINSSCQTL